MHLLAAATTAPVISEQLLYLVFFIIFVALIFDFLNGLHDAANSIATIVSTRVLTPRAAVVWAAFFNFLAFVVFPHKVAKTIQGDIVDPLLFGHLEAQAEFQHFQMLIGATLLAACGWN